MITPREIIAACLGAIVSGLFIALCRTEYECRRACCMTPEKQALPSPVIHNKFKLMEPVELPLGHIPADVRSDYAGVKHLIGIRECWCWPNDPLTGHSKEPKTQSPRDYRRMEPEWTERDQIIEELKSIQRGPC